MSTPHQAVQGIVARGWRPVPVPAGSKGPTLRGWERLETADLMQHFNGGPQNVGIVLGAPSGGLVDVDLDAPEAIAASAEFLPRTGMVHGRPSKPRSHYWYVSAGAVTKEWADPVRDDSTKAMLVELRSTGGQTLVPPSVHPSGERCTAGTVKASRRRSMLTR